MVRFVWTEDTIAEEAKKHESRSKFALNGAGAYQAAIKIGILDKVCANMKPPPTWLEKAIAKHGDKYDYSKSTHTGSRNNVTITCRIHGDFELNSAAHLQGKGCQKCARESRKVGLSKWIEECTKVHKGKYDYSKSEYIDSKSKVLVICPEHGEFWAIAHDHKKGHGCKLCANEQIGKSIRVSYEEFLARAMSVHGDKFEYKNYVMMTKPMIFVCKTCGDALEKTPLSFLSGCGCNACFLREFSDSLLIKYDEFSKRLTDKYQGRVAFERSEYKGYTAVGKAYCEEHGPFESSPRSLMYTTHGCPSCARQATVNGTSKPHVKFIEDCISVHGDKYDYSKTKYTREVDKITITCKKHGDFEQTAGSHVCGRGCPKCSSNNSKADEELLKYAQMIDRSAHKTRKILGGMEIDIYCSNKLCGFEHNGLYWHSVEQKGKGYHLEKFKVACSAGVELHTIYEDDYANNPELIHNFMSTKISDSLVDRVEVTTKLPDLYAKSYPEKFDGDLFVVAFSSDKVVGAVRVTESAIDNLHGNKSACHEILAFTRVNFADKTLIINNDFCYSTTICENYKLSTYTEPDKFYAYGKVKSRFSFDDRCWIVEDSGKSLWKPLDNN